MAKILFSDGEQLVDDPYVDLITRATDGEPGRFTFKDAMRRVGRQNERDFLRNAQKTMVDDHLRNYGR